MGVAKAARGSVRKVKKVGILQHILFELLAWGWAGLGWVADGSLVDVGRWKG